MRKLILCLICALMLTLCAPFSVLVRAENEPPTLWDGSVAKGFAGGDGSKENPFRIENAAQLAYFAQSMIDYGFYVGKHVKLCADIRLNDEVITFEPDTGMVKTTDGKIVTYCGTGYNGDNSGENTQFNTEPSVLGQWYSVQYRPLSSYNIDLPAVTLLPFPSIQDFGGSFDGGGHSIDGLYVNGRGLFDSASGGTLTNIHLKNAFVMGSENVGGIVGSAKERTVTVKYCSFDGIALGHTNVGGIVGNMGQSSILSFSTSSGTVIGQNYVGGTAGYGNGIEYCINSAAVYGAKRVGGIAGYSATAMYSTNCGAVTANDHTGGIVGTSANGITHCHNLAAVHGNDRVGGICGSVVNVERAIINSCYNAASVDGNDHVGGIIGYGVARMCENSGDVSGRYNVGGIVGNSHAADSKNGGSVQGDKHVGGIVGYGSAQECGNLGKVSGTENVGGVLGSANANVENCYNTGKVLGDTTVGGVVGGARDVKNCYNSGEVFGKQYVGGVIGKYTDGHTLNNLYYLYGCASLESVFGAQDGIGNSVDGYFSSVRSLTWEEMATEAPYDGFDFGSTWVISTFGGQNYPTLKVFERSLVEHVPTQSAKEIYLVNPVPCGETPLYRTSCGCGAVLDETFAGKASDGHEPVGSWLADSGRHWQVCGKCHESFGQAEHLYKDATAILSEEGKTEIEIHCRTCGHKTLLPVEQVTGSPQGTTTQKAAFKLDLRFVILLFSGVVLGAVGSYGVITVKDLRRKQKRKKKDFI